MVTVLFFMLLTFESDSLYKEGRQGTEKGKNRRGENSSRAFPVQIFRFIIFVFLFTNLTCAFFPSNKISEKMSVQDYHRPMPAAVPISAERCYPAPFSHGGINT